jgi:hypothetical protein
MMATDLHNFTADQITLPVLTQIVNEATLEGFTLEYKRELGNGAKVLTAVAAMANTWGGLILVGVDEQRDKGTGFGAPGPDGIVGVRAADRSRLANMCSAQLVPPFDPQIHAIEIPGDAVVLAVTVYSEIAPRPVMYDGRVLVRTDAGNRPADLFRLRDLFTHQGHAGGGLVMVNTSNATPFNHVAFTEDPPADLVVRAMAAVPLLPINRLLKLTDSVRTGLQQSLSQAKLSGWLGRMLTLFGGSNLNPWLPAGLSTADRMEFRWEGFPVLREPQCVFPEARLSIELPVNLTGRSATQLDLELDVIIRTTSLAQHLDPPPPGPARIGLEDLYFLLDALIETFAATLGPAVNDHIGTPTGPMTATRVGLVTNNGRPISDVVNTTGLTVVRGNQPAAGSSLEPDPDLNWSNPDDRKQQGVEWMRELLLDLHFERVDQVIARIVG